MALKNAAFAILAVIAVNRVADGPGAIPGAAASSCGKNEYCVRRQTMSGTCKVQEGTERPQFGAYLSGPFSSRQDATKEMCRLYEPASEDTGKCSAVLPADACGSKK
jgi:hypothetical protein